MKINPRLRIKILLLATISMFSMSVLQATEGNAQIVGSGSSAPVGGNPPNHNNQMTIFNPPHSTSFTVSPFVRSQSSAMAEAFISPPVQWPSNDPCYIPEWLEEQSKALRSMLLANKAIDSVEFQKHEPEICAKQIFIYRMNILKQSMGK